MTTEFEIVGFGVLVRHMGFVDRLLPAEGYAHYPTDNINHWTCGPNRKPMCLATEAEAQALADDLAEKFGEKGYRFTVAVCRLMPRWHILRPDWEGEKVAIGSREQIF